eukprot:7141117-Alexandrium_andersonii.AAC.2
MPVGTKCPRIFDPRGPSAHEGLAVGAKCPRGLGPWGPSAHEALARGGQVPTRPWPMGTKCARGLGPWQPSALEALARGPWGPSGLAWPYQQHKDSSRWCVLLGPVCAVRACLTWVHTVPMNLVGTAVRPVIRDPKGQPRARESIIVLHMEAGARIDVHYGFVGDAAPGGEGHPQANVTKVDLASPPPQAP